jgi:DNA sulfur modification protein DndD
LPVCGRNAVNDFLQLDKQRQTLELYIRNLPNLIQQRETLERSTKGGNEELIAEYEKRQGRVKELKLQEAQAKDEIQQLTKRINGIDVQMQQEPDPKYDTLVQLVPFFSDVTDELLKQKRRLIETEMKKQLNMMLNSIRIILACGNIGLVGNFTIKMNHTAGERNIA